jgi:SPP1 family predicted phage head-tail adaptor
MGGLKVGPLRDRVSLQSQSTILNSNGDQVKIWTEFAQVWADIHPMSAREFSSAQQMTSNMMGRITIRYRADVNASCRIVKGTTVYNIVGALPDPDTGSEWLTLPISQGINEG